MADYDQLSGRGFLWLGFHQATNRIAQLRAVVLPIGNSVTIQAQSFLRAARDGIIKPDALDEPAITPIARISYHNVIKGAFFSSAASKTNDNHITGVIVRM